MDRTAWEKIKRHGLVGGTMLQGAGFEVTRTHAIFRMLFASCLGIRMCTPTCCSSVILVCSHDGEGTVKLKETLSSVSCLAHGVSSRQQKSMQSVCLEWCCGKRRRTL